MPNVDEVLGESMQKTNREECEYKIVLNERLSDADLDFARRRPEPHNCTCCGSSSISTQYDAGWDVDENGEDHQHLDHCANCGATRLWGVYYKLPETIDGEVVVKAIVWGGDWTKSPYGLTNKDNEECCKDGGIIRSKKLRKRIIELLAAKWGKLLHFSN
jgi:hypothetical protein